ncbi:MAG: rod shape-determining protein MreD, partial [Humibacillus sp.]|nr:rod shape-determining protein MreD [Humibacillus sp.]
MRVTLLGLARTAYVVVAALVSATVLPRLGVPQAWAPDLVLIGVVATAVVRGPVHGALVGLLAGWVVELVPPVGTPLGVTPLVIMLGGLVAGLLRRESPRTVARAVVALAAA